MCDQDKKNPHLDEYPGKPSIIQYFAYVCIPPTVKVYVGDANPGVRTVVWNVLQKLKLGDEILPTQLLFFFLR